MFPQNYYFYRMKRQLCTIAMTVMTLVGAAAAGSDSLSRWVNPMIGTNGMGHTFPGACWPFGIVQLSPDTDTVPHNIDGLCGNDDCGQMSAWYIFSAMGFYPVCPGSGEYILGAPYLPYMKINLENGRTLEIKAARRGRSPETHHRPDPRRRHPRVRDERPALIFIYQQYKFAIPAVGSNTRPSRRQLSS